MITEKTPSDWRELQRDVAQILDECGFDVEVEKTLRTVRGDTEVDVYAEETHRGRKNVILCECKHWKARVPKTVVHAFRTTVADTGANVGYIIGSSGFQSGAFDAAELSNIKLRTWVEFQEEFQEQWLENHIVPYLWKRVGSFLSLTEPVGHRAGRELTREEWEAFHELREAEMPVASLVNHYMPWQRHLKVIHTPVLPLGISDYWSTIGVPDQLLAVRGYREFFHLIVEHTNEAAIRLGRALFRAG